MINGLSPVGQSIAPPARVNRGHVVKIKSVAAPHAEVIDKDRQTDHEKHQRKKYADSFHSATILEAA